MNTERKIYKFHVFGTHCPSCKILIEDILTEQDFIESSRVDLKKETIEIETSGKETREELASILTDKLKFHGYAFSTEKIKDEKRNNEIIWQALPIGLVFLALFFVLQKSGILNLGFGGEITPLSSFIIGIIASFSSCLAIVGGLVLSLSAKVAKDENGSSKKPYALFHLGRLLAFAFLGGLLGLIGKAIGVNFMFSAILGLIASVVMIALGVNLLGIFKKNLLTLPSGTFSFFRKIEHATLAPILVGVGTFFLPCGFTQAMQVSAIGSESFFSGMLIMFAFALGTLPMLSLLSFGSASFAHSKYAPLFFKSAGVVVLGFGLFAFISGLAGLGIINPLFSL